MHTDEQGATVSPPSQNDHRQAVKNEAIPESIPMTRSIAYNAITPMTPTVSPPERPQSKHGTFLIFLFIDF